MNNSQIEENNERWNLDSFLNEFLIFHKDDELGGVLRQGTEPNESEKNTEEESGQKSE